MVLFFCNNWISSVATIPRYIRVNILKATVSEVVQCFQNEGFRLLSTENSNIFQLVAFINPPDWLIITVLINVR